MFNKTLHRPMFRKGGSTGSAGVGITSGLQAPRQQYQGTGDSSDQLVEKNLRNMNIKEIQEYTDSLYKAKPRNNKDL